MLRYSKQFLILAIMGSVAAGGCSSRGEDSLPGETVSKSRLQLAGTGISAEIAVYPGGSSFSSNVVVTNTGTAATTNWEVDIQLNNATVVGAPWNCTSTQTGTVLTLRSNSGNSVLAPGGTAWPGLNGVWNTTPYLNPTVIAVRRDVGMSGTGGASSGGAGGSAGKGGTSTGGKATGGSGTGGKATGGSGTGGAAMGGTGTGGALTGGTTSGGAAGAAGAGNATSTSGGSGGSSGNNVAQNKTATASSSLSGNPASYGNDVSSTTSWCASTSALNEWWSVDLGADYALTGTEVTWPQSGRVYQYFVSISSDGTNYSEVVNQRGNTRTAQTQADSFTAQGRYLRLQVTGLATSPATSACIGDFKAFGTPVASSGGGGAPGTGTVPSSDGGTVGTGGTSDSSSGGTSDSGGTSGTGATTSTGSTSSGASTSTGGTSSDVPGTDVEFSFKLPKGVHRNEVALATTGGDLYISADVTLTSGSGYAAVSAVAGGKLARLGVSAQVGNVWSDGVVGLANFAAVNGNLNTTSTVDAQAGASVKGTTKENADIGPLQTVKWTVHFPITNAAAANVDASTTIPPGAYASYFVKPAGILHLASGTYTFDSMIVDDGGALEVDNRRGPVFVYLRDGFIFRGAISQRGSANNVLFGVAGTSTVQIEHAFSGIVVAPNASITLAAAAGGHRGAFFANSITANQSSAISLIGLLPQSFCALESLCSSFCPCPAGAQSCSSDDVCDTGLSCDQNQRCACLPQCAGKVCGDQPDDGCGGSCQAYCANNETGCTNDGQCPMGSKCFIGGGPKKGFPAQTNICLPSVCADQDPAKPSCGVGTADCGTCPACIPNCDGRSCGSDGCGGSCGAAGTGELCIAGRIVTMLPDTGTIGGHSANFPPALTPDANTASVGTLPGTLAVTPNGSPSYSVPIEVPPGRNGVQPSISIAYVGGATNGILGLRWALTGLSKIERCAKTVAIDGNAQQVQLNAEDAYCMDGSRLIADQGSSGAPSHDFHTEVESFQLIRAGDVTTGSGGEYLGPAYFIVYTKDGQQLTYGSRGIRGQNMDSIVTTRGVRRVWNLTEIRDRSGAHVTLSYRQVKSGSTTTEVVPSEIAYGGLTTDDATSPALLAEHSRSLKFGYAERPDPRHHYVLGEQTHSTERLTHIQTFAEGRPVRYYEIQYETRPAFRATQFNETQLAGVRVCGFTASGAGGTCLPYTRFNYYGLLTSPTFYEYPSNDSSDYPFKRIVAVLDANGDGRDDLLVRRRKYEPEMPFVGSMALYLSNWQPMASSEPQYDVVPVEMLLDGATAAQRDAIGSVNDQALQLFLQRAINSRNAPYLVVDVNSDSRDDIVFQTNMIKFDVDPWDPAYNAPSSSEYPELAAANPEDNTWSEMIVYRSNGTGFVPTTYPTRCWSDNVMLADVDSDGLRDRVCCVNSRLYVSRNNGVDGFDPEVFAPIGDRRCEFLLPIDTDGNGSQEIMAFYPSGQKPDVLVGADPKNWHPAWKDANFTTAPNVNHFWQDWDCDSNPGTCSIIATSPGFHDKGVGLAAASVLDSNGDGLQDFFDGHALWHNTGNGFVPIGITLPLKHLDDFAEPERVLVLDYDNDGRQDLVNPFRQSLLRSTDYGAMEVVEINETPCKDDPNHDVNRAVLADLNGDGNKEWVCSSPTSPANAVAGVLWGRHALTSLLTSVENGVGKLDAITYNINYHFHNSALKPERVYSPGTGITPTGTVRLRRVAPVVASYEEMQQIYNATGSLISTTHNATHDFYFGDGNFGLGGRGWYGLGSVVENVKDPSGAIDRTVTTLYNNDVFWRAGTMAYQRIDYAESVAGFGHSSSFRKESTTYDWRQYSTPVSTRGKYVAPASVEHQSWVQMFRATELEHSTSVLSYDDYGNVKTNTTTVETIGQTQNDSSFVEFTFDYMPSRWLMTNPATQHTMRTLGSDVQVLDVGYSYYPSGLLDTTTRQPGDPAFEQNKKLVRGDLFGNVTEVRVSGHSTQAYPPRSTFIDYDDRGIFPIRYTNAKSQPTEVQYDLRTGQLLTSLDPNGVVAQRQYDLLGRLVRMQAPTETLTRVYQHPSFGFSSPKAALNIATTIVGGVENRYSEDTFDARGNLVLNAKRGLGGVMLTQETNLDWQDRITSVALPHVPGDISQGAKYYFYDSMGRTVKEVLPDQREVAFSYPNPATADTDVAALFEQSSENPVEAVIALQPNGRGEVALSNRQDQPVFVGHWDEAHSSSGIGGLLSGIGAISTYKYDAMSRLQAVTDPDNETTILGYDKVGRRWSVANPTTGTRTFTFTPFDEQASQTDAEGQTLCRYYDALGRPVSVTKGSASGACSELNELIDSWQYDGTGPNEVGKLVGSWRRASPTSNEGTSLVYQYETVPDSGANAGRLKSTTQRSPGLNAPLVTTYDYDGPWIHQVTYPSANGTPFAVQYGYDGAGAVAEVRNADTAQVMWHGDFEMGKRLKSEQFGNNIETQFSYFDLAMSPNGPRCVWGASFPSCTPGAVRSMVTQAHGATGGSPQRHLEYDYDATGAVGSVTTILASGERDRMAYERDYLGRLRNEQTWVGTSRLKISVWDYTHGGDIKEIRDGIGNAVLQAYGYGDSSRRHRVTSMNTEVFGYNANGSQIRREGNGIPNALQEIDYNDFEMPWRLRGGSGGDTSVEYDASHNRTAKRGPSKTNIYASGGTYSCEGATPSASGTMHCESEHYSVYANGKLVAVLSAQDTLERSVEYVHGDHLGSSSMTTNEAGVIARQRAFGAFGSTTSSIGESPIKSGFTGHEHDDGLGLVNMRGRLYDPVLSRFITADPFVRSPFDPQGMNRYSYVRNDPLSLVDPLGFQGEPPASVGHVPCPTGGPGQVAVYYNAAGEATGTEAQAPCNPWDIPEGFMRKAAASGSSSSGSGQGPNWSVGGGAPVTNSGNGASTLAGPGTSPVPVPNAPSNGGGLGATITPYGGNNYVGPGGQPLGAYIGGGIHNRILDEYRTANSPDKVEGNNVPLNRIVSALGGNGAGMGSGKGMPDIVNLTTREIYEIKRAGHEADGVQQVTKYAAAAAAAGAPLSFGGPGPGTNGVINYPTGLTVTYVYSGPGLITYDYTFSAPGVPVPAPSPDRDMITAPDFVPYMIWGAVAATVIGVASAMTGGTIIVLVPLMVGM